VSILGDLAVKNEMQLLLDFMDSLDSLPPEERLHRLREQIRTIMLQATAGRGPMGLSLVAPTSKSDAISPLDHLAAIQTTQKPEPKPAG
jgi:hypothetical protein